MRARKEYNGFEEKRDQLSYTIQARGSDKHILAY